MSHLGMITVVVDDYDTAIDYYTTALGFTLMEDTKMSETKRWVVVAPDANQGAALLLAQAASPEQSAAIGNQSKVGTIACVFCEPWGFRRSIL